MDEELAARVRKLKTEVHNSLAAALARFVESTGFVATYVALVDVVDEHGERGMYTITSEGMKSWELLGSLAYADAFERAEITALHISKLTEED